LAHISNKFTFSFNPWKFVNIPIEFLIRFAYSSYGECDGYNKLVNNLQTWGEKSKNYIKFRYLVCIICSCTYHVNSSIDKIMLKKLYTFSPTSNKGLTFRRSSEQVQKQVVFANNGLDFFKRYLWVVLFLLDFSAMRIVSLVSLLRCIVQVDMYPYKNA